METPDRGRGERPAPLVAAPRGWFAWDYALLWDGREVARVDVARLRERGAVRTGEGEWTIRREGVMRGDFLLEAGGAVVARATKRSPFLRAFQVETSAGDRFTLEAESALGRTMLLLREGASAGEIRPLGPFTWRAAADLPDGLALPVKGFLLWLAVILWRRDAES